MTLPKPGHPWKQKSIHQFPMFRCVSCDFITRREKDVRLLNIKSPMGNVMYVCKGDEVCTERAVQFMDDLDIAWSRACSENRNVIY